MISKIEQEIIISNEEKARGMHSNQDENGTFDDGFTFGILMCFYELLANADAPTLVEDIIVNNGLDIHPLLEYAQENEDIILPYLEKFIEIELSGDDL